MFECLCPSIAGLNESFIWVDSIKLNYINFIYIMWYIFWACFEKTCFLCSKMALTSKIGTETKKLQCFKINHLSLSYPKVNVKQSTWRHWYWTSRTQSMLPLLPSDYFVCVFNLRTCLASFKASYTRVICFYYVARHIEGYLRYRRLNHLHSITQISWFWKIWN